MKITSTMTIAKTLVWSLIGAVLLSGVWLAAAPPACAQSKTVTLKFVSAYAALHPSVVNGINPWIEALKEKSGGRLIIQFYTPGTLTPANEHWDAVKGGVADIAFEVTHNMFPLSEVVAMPFMFQSTEAASLTRWALLEQFPEMAAEYDGTKLLWGHTSAQYQLHTNKKKVTSLDDVKGLRIIVWTANGRKFGSVLGISPQELHSLDTYMALQRGMADGVFCPLAPMRSLKLDEVTKYHNVINFAQDAFWGVMNTRAFNRLPADLQQLITEETGANMARIMGKTLDDGSKAAVEFMKSKGHEFIDMTEDELTKWRGQMTPIYEEWITEMEGKGHKNARKMFEAAVELGNKFQADIDAR